MTRLPQEKEPHPHRASAAPSEMSRIVRTGVLSLLLHLALAAFLIFNSLSTFTWGGRKVYRVTLRPFSPPGDGLPSGGSGTGLPRTREALSDPSTIEKPRSDKGSKRSEVHEGAKPDQRKMDRAEKGETSRTTQKQKKQEQSREAPPVEGLKKTHPRVEKVEREKESGKSLQEAMEEIRKKAALDEIQKRVARRSGTEKRTSEGTFRGGGTAGNQGTGPSSSGPVLSSSRGSSTGGSGPGAGKGSGSGTGTGTGTGTGSGGSPWGSSGFESKLNDYYSLIWAKIKEGWTLPEDLPKGKADLEAIIVILIDQGGKLQKAWFEKKSGYPLYDQMAMRAIKKAEPFPPIPKELGEETFEIGIRFHPE